MNLRDGKIYIPNKNALGFVTLTGTHKIYRGVVPVERKNYVVVGHFVGTRDGNEAWGEVCMALRNGVVLF